MGLDKISVAGGVLDGVAIGMAVIHFIPPTAVVPVELLLTAGGSAGALLARTLLDDPPRRSVNRRARRHRRGSAKPVDQSAHNAKRHAPRA